MAAHNRPADRGLLTDAAVGPDDGVLDDGVLFDVALASDHAVGTDARSRLDDGALVDEAGAFDDRALFNPRVGRHPDALCRPVVSIGDCREWQRAVASVHDVAMDLHVLLRSADVDPVPAVHISD